MITNPVIEDYLHSLIPERSPLLMRLEQQAHEEGIPIVQLPSAQMMRLLLLTHRPKRILEVGTAIGYSTIWLAEAAPEASIVTMEMDEDRISQARKNFVEAGVADRIELIEGDATRGLPNSYQFDCLFIDAAKGQYRAFLELYLPLLVPGGLIISDNVLFRGLVATPDECNKRQRPLVEKINQYNQLLMNHSELDTSIVPIGDGIAISYKRS
ncbi:O-methyltransferase [Brevibacillus sp. SYSU BS000544]|uniref:O-methyltransferase n=1 Tax=Brevibacillus sp. SYSU BS000544 TaxID=3416443 RepID=UPI003CE5865B